MKKLMEWILPIIISMYHKMENFTKKERLAQDNFFKKLNTNVQRKTKKPIVIAMVGLVGSGKSYVANKIASEIGAVVLSGDDVRVELRKVGEKYEGARKIVENVAVDLVRKGINVILDLDYVDDKKRASVRAKIKGTEAKIIFVRTICNYDIVVERILKQKFEKSRDDFFGGAGIESNYQNSGAVVKLRELWRRTPQHYKWVNEVGGEWIPKKLSFKHFVVNTDDEKSETNVLRELWKN